MLDYATARLTMVESQLRTNKVIDERVLEAFLAVPRERFVPPALSGTAYIDDDLPLGHGRYLMEPMIGARLLQLAQISDEDTVLEIGCASGYGTALLSRLARSVVAIEEIGEFCRQAAARLRELAVDNAEVIEVPLVAGYAARAPYGAIIFTGAVARIPDAIAAQLAEGGRMVAVRRNEGGTGCAMVMTRIGGTLSERPVFDAAIPLLPGFQAAPSFVF